MDVFREAFKLLLEAEKSFLEISFLSSSFSRIVDAALEAPAASTKFCRDEAKLVVAPWKGGSSEDELESESSQSLLIKLKSISDELSSSESEVLSL